MNDEIPQLCRTCGVGYYLHLGESARCDHCDSPRHSAPGAADPVAAFWSGFVAGVIVTILVMILLYVLSQ